MKDRELTSKICFFIAVQRILAEWVWTKHLRNTHKKQEAAHVKTYDELIAYIIWLMKTVDRLTDKGRRKFVHNTKASICDSKNER